MVLFTSAFSLPGLNLDNMARRFLAALALAHSAAALLEGFVDVLVKVDVQVSPNAFGELKAAETDLGYDACVAADAVLLDCDREGHLDTTTLSNDAVDCICCAGTTPISAVYSICASYASEESAPTAYSCTPATPLAWFALFPPNNMLQWHPKSTVCAPSGLIVAPGDLPARRRLGPRPRLPT